MVQQWREWIGHPVTIKRMVETRTSPPGAVVANTFVPLQRRGLKKTSSVEFYSMRKFKGRYKPTRGVSKTKSSGLGVLRRQQAAYGLPK